MKFSINIEPNENKTAAVYQGSSPGINTFELAYIGAYTYIKEMYIDSGVEFSANKDNLLWHNLQIGNHCSVGNNLNILMGKNHEITMISSGTVNLMDGIDKGKMNTKFCQKGQIIIQNDVWIGDDVTIMPNVIIRNGACVAKNSHVVSDVPPYAIVGGNPAKVIGYRFAPEHIEKLQKMQWWYWDTDEIVKNSAYFMQDDIELFLETFSTNMLFEKYRKKCDFNKRTFFCVADLRGQYPSYPLIIEQFLDKYYGFEQASLVLFVENKLVISESDRFKKLYELCEDLKNESGIACDITLFNGNKEDAVNLFESSTDYITTRVENTVFYTCLADVLGINIISGVDSVISFDKRRNTLPTNP